MVSTQPTARGKEEIDAFHPLYGLHYLNHKYVRDFMSGEDRTQWLRIEKGKVGMGCAIWLSLSVDLILFVD